MTVTMKSFAPHWLTTLFLFSCFGGNRLVASKTCILKASTIVNRQLNVPLERFRDWFSLSDIPTRLVNLNPGVKSIEIVTDSLHRAYLTPVKFPWTTITCTIDYDIKHIKGKSLTVDCREDAITQIFEGPKVLVDSLSSVKLLAAGSGNFFIDEAQKSFSVGVNIRVAIPIPDFYPDFLTQNMESIGSGVLQRKVEYDLGTLLDNVLAAHKIWEADRSFLIADKVREERRQKVTF